MKDTRDQKFRMNLQLFAKPTGQIFWISGFNVHGHTKGSLNVSLR